MGRWLLLQSVKGLLISWIPILVLFFCRPAWYLFVVVAYRHLEKGDIDHGMDNASARRNLLEL